jgi:hypothetical protein
LLQQANHEALVGKHQNALSVIGEKFDRRALRDQRLSYPFCGRDDVAAPTVEDDILYGYKVEFAPSIQSSFALHGVIADRRFVVVGALCNVLKPLML